jgi:hypothetical protein
MYECLSDALSAARDGLEVNQRVPCTIVMLVHYQQQPSTGDAPKIDIITTRPIPPQFTSLFRLLTLDLADTVLRVVSPDRATWPSKPKSPSQIPFTI